MNISELIAACKGIKGDTAVMIRWDAGEGGIRFRPNGEVRTTDKCAFAIVGMSRPPKAPAAAVKATKATKANSPTKAANVARAATIKAGAAKVTAKRAAKATAPVVAPASTTRRRGTATLK